MPRKKEPSIRLSPKHGVNPSISVCFICGEDKNELILPGRLRDDKEAPRRAVWNMEPCDTCKGYTEKGVIIVNAVGNERNPQPTGRFVVVTDDAIRKILKDPEPALKARIMFMDNETWDMVGLPRESTEV